jgi:hypothetical protein
MLQRSIGEQCWSLNPSGHINHFDEAFPRTANPW